MPWGLLTLGLLTCLPGDAFCRLFFTAPSATPRRLLHTGEQVVLRFLAGVVLVGWWALLLAEAGWYGPLPVLIGVILGSALLYALAWRRHGRAIWRVTRPHFSAYGIALVAVLVLSGLLLFSHPFETVVGSEDAGIYFNSGGLIARSGAIRQFDPGLGEFGDAAADAASNGTARHVLLPPPDRGDGTNKRFLFLDWQRLAGFNLIPGAGNTVTPQFLHLFAVWLALWSTFGGGVGAMVYTSIAFGLLGTALTATLARRLFGTGSGLLAGLLLAANGLQLWFARESLTEIFLQVLLVGALLAWAIFCDLRDQQALTAARGATLLAALALGSVALTHAQFVFTILPVAALVCWLWLARRWQRLYWWFLLPFALLWLHAGWHIAVFSLGYFEGIYHHVWKNALRDWPKTTVMLGTPLLLLVLLGWAGVRNRWLPLLQQRRTQQFLRWATGLAVVVIGGWLYVIRPGIVRPGHLGQLAGYIGAPIPAGAGAALVPLGWYLSPLGIVLAGVGLVQIILQRFEERIAAALCVTLPFVVLFLTGSYTQGGYIYSLRRFVPIIVPLAVILIAVACTQIGSTLATVLRHPAWRRPLQAVGIGLAALLVVFLVYTTPRLALHREYAGVLAATAQLASQSGPDSLLLFSGPRDETPKLATPLNYLFNRESWTITTNLPNGAKLDTWLSEQQAQGRQIQILMSAGGGKLFLPNQRLVPVQRITVPLLQFEKLDYQKPFNQQLNNLSYTLYTLAPVPAGQSALGTLPYSVIAGQGDEAALLSPNGATPGFYNLETDPGTTAPVYRWTDGEALIRLPWPADGRPLTVRLTLSAGPRPASLPPARAVLGLRPTPGDEGKEVPLGEITVSNDWAEYVVTIPANAMPSTPDHSALLHIAMPRVPDGKKWRPAPGATWKPGDFPLDTKNSADSRELHIRFARLDVRSAP